MDPVVLTSVMLILILAKPAYETSSAFYDLTDDAFKALVRGGKFIITKAKAKVNK